MKKKASTYVKNKKGIKKGKWAPADEDIEDYEQEKLIKEWLKRQATVRQFDYQYINGKGNVRSSLVKASISLDQAVNEDTDTKFGDLIAGNIELYLGSGGDSRSDLPEAIEVIQGYLSALNFNKGEIEWVIKILRLSIQESKWLFEKSQTNSEW